MVAGYGTPTVHKKLGIAQPPRKPLSPYYRFILEMRPIIVAKYPDLSPHELMKTIAKQWNNVDLKQREKYEIEFKKEQVQMQF